MDNKVKPLFKVGDRVQHVLGTCVIIEVDIETEAHCDEVEVKYAVKLDEDLTEGDSDSWWVPEESLMLERDYLKRESLTILKRSARGSLISGIVPLVILITVIMSFFYEWVAFTMLAAIMLFTLVSAVFLIMDTYKAARNYIEMNRCLKEFDKNKRN